MTTDPTTSTSGEAADAATFLDLPDLACDEVGGAALLCNDEFFAEKECLLRARPAEWREHEYTDRGKWMDGWESRRRREPGHDWCIVRLGMPGIVRGVVVDTAYFRGNFPEECSLEACEIDAPLDLAALATATWTEVLPRSALKGDTKNAFAIGHLLRATHLRLNIFPDGGVARLRVHGMVAPNWRRLRASGLIDLVALEHGGWVESCSDMFFGSRNNLIKPGPSRSMADGWETRRRRGPGNDWAIVRLAAPGHIERLEIDTSHFKGNAPGRCVVEGGSPGPEGFWQTLVASPLQPHTRHVFDDDLRRIWNVTHLRLSVFPDGGVARLRAWGRPAMEMDGAELGESAGVERLNSLGANEARTLLLQCCGSGTWAARMVAARPFEDLAALQRIAEAAWWQIDEPDWLEAFAAHPQIGEQGGGAWSATEQRGVHAAGTANRAELATNNQAYLDRFGFIYIVCASGRSAPSMLADLEARLGHTRGVELRTAREEQAKITRLRLARLVEELASTSGGGSR